MSNNFFNNNDYSGLNRVYRPSGFGKRRRRKRMRNRILIISVIVILLAGIITGIVFLSKAIFGKKDDKNKDNVPAVVATENISTKDEVEKEPKVEDQYIKSNVKDNNLDPEEIDGVYIWNDSAFQPFTLDDEAAENYSNTISQFKDKLGKNIKLYNMVIPSSIEFGIPERLKKEKVKTDSQADFLKKVYSSYKSDVIPVNCYNLLAKNANEYTYFKTDDTWTGLGAYYAYTDFIKATGMNPVALTDCTKSTIEGFRGDFASSLSGSGLWDKPDKIDYYKTPNRISGLIKKTNSGEVEETTVFDEKADGYDVFIHGSNPLFIIKSDIESNKKILVVKEYYGNAFVPYLAANYKEVHVIDYRRWAGDLKSYCEGNKIDEVLFLNSIDFASSSSKVEIMKTIFSWE